LNNLKHKMKTGNAGLLVMGNKTSRREVDNQTTDIRKDMFKLLEDERERIVQVLQDDVGQLISIASMQLTGEAARQVNASLSLALARLRSLIFELKPNTLNRMDLATALTLLFNQRFKEYPSRFAINLYQLPKGMNSQVETAIFRIAQKALSHFNHNELSHFELSVTRTDHQICIKSRFELEPSEADFTASDFCETSLKKALNTLVYLYYGSMHCRALSDNHMEFVITLDESKLQ
jgi:signal transduction histidine kinase